MPNTVSLSDFVGQLSLGLDAVEGGLLGAEPFHGKRVAVLCVAMGRYLGYGPGEIFTLAACALLHDNALTEYILSERPGEGRAINVKTHCVMGERNCAAVPFPTPAEGLILYHHEQADGGGPFGLGEGAFPEGAGLIALADRTDVALKLQRPGEGKLAEIRDFVAGRRGRIFTAAAAEAALAALDEDLLARLSDDRIAETFTADMPDMSRALTDDELIRISGITAKIIDYKSRFTQVHTTQIANKAWYMAGTYGWDDTLKAKFYEAAALHDLGKLFVPTPILEKPGRLSDEEFRVIQSHVWHTWNLLRRVRGFEEIAVWAADHHEKLDGTGYPFGKKGPELDEKSRLLACLDIYQAVREERPYHPERSHAETMEVLYGMAERGGVDGKLCADLDRRLGLLDRGIAEGPPALG